MTAKEYLSQARKLNVLISSKIDFVEKLKLLAFNVSSCKENSKHTNKDQGSIRCVEKIDEMQIEINADIDKYIFAQKYAVMSSRLKAELNRLY